MVIPFSPPRIDDKIINEVIAALKSGWITTGARTKLFEKKLSAYNGNPNTLCTNSATAGLELVLRWFGVGKNDEVIIPAYTYCATANVVIHCGAKPVFVDVNKEDFNISVEEIKKKITKKTKVIMPVDFAGMPCDYKEINELVKKENIKSLFVAKSKMQEKLGRILILSDSAHSLGASYFGKKTGSLTDISVFSFHAVKNLITAEGGAIAFNLPDPFDNLEVYKYFAIFGLHGQSKDALAKTKKGSWKYDVIEAGYKTNMTDVLAAIGLIELERYENDTLKKRKFIFDKYTEAFSNNKIFQIPVYKKNNKISSFHLYPLRIKNINEEQRNEIMKRIFNKNVSVNVHFQPLPILSFYKNLGYKISDFPNSYDNYSREISIPVFYNMTEKNINKVISAVNNSI